MKAAMGDRISVLGRSVDRKVRDGEIIGLLKPDGEPPYRVRWDDGHEAIVFPGSDARIQHFPRRRPPRTADGRRAAG